MKIGIINGSHRSEAQSAKVADFLQKLLTEKSLSDDVYRLDLTNNPIPLWDQGIWDGDEKWQALLQPISEQLMSCDGFVVIAPEYHGMVPSGLKNFFLMWGKGELFHKPALITAVSNGTGGAYPVAELRMSSYKNNRICYIPEQLIIRDVDNVLNDSADNDAEADGYFRQRAEYALGVLCRYADALKGMRDQGGLFNPDFKNGM